MRAEQGSRPSINRQRCAHFNVKSCRALMYRVLVIVNTAFEGLSVTARRRSLPYSRCACHGDVAGRYAHCVIEFADVASVACLSRYRDARRWVDAALTAAGVNPISKQIFYRQRAASQKNQHQRTRKVVSPQGPRICRKTARSVMACQPGYRFISAPDDCISSGRAAIRRGI